jgi:hypothetical protein
MMKLSRISDYGIVLMTLIANRDDDAAPHNAREVAAQAELPLPVVSKILKSLAREGLLVSHRGAKGSTDPSASRSARSTPASASRRPAVTCGSPGSASTTWSGGPSPR